MMTMSADRTQPSSSATAEASQQLAELEDYRTQLREEMRRLRSGEWNPPQTVLEHSGHYSRVQLRSS